MMYKDKIYEVLRISGRPLTAMQISKHIKSAWIRVKSSLEELESEEKVERVGEGRKVSWKIK